MRMLRHPGLVIILALSLAPVLRPSGAAAMTFGAWGGWHVPSPSADTRGTLHLKRDAHAFGGGTLSRYPRNRFGHEITIGFTRAPSSLTGSGRTTYADLDLLAGSWTLLTRLTPPDAKFSVLARVGPAWMHHSTTLDIVHGRSDYGVALGLGARHPLLGVLGIRADVEDFLYRADFGAGRDFRHDLVLRAGVELGRRK